MERVDLLTVKRPTRFAAVMVTCGVALVVALPYSTIGHEFALVTMCVVAVASIAVGVRRYRPSHRALWVGFGVTIVLFAASFALRLLFPETMAPRIDGDPRVPDYIDIAAFFCAAMSMHWLGHARDDDSDPTTVIDSIILAGGVSTIVWLVQVLPVLEDETLTRAGQLISFTLALLAIWLTYCSVRLILTPSVRTRSSTMLSLATFFSVAAQLSAVSASPRVSNTSLTFGMIALGLVALSALDPSMARLTERVRAEPDPTAVGQMSSRRMALMTLALLIGPAALLAKLLLGTLNTLVAGCLIASWAAVTVFVMLRLAGLVRAREQLARADRTMSKAAASLVASADREATAESALAAMMELASPSAPPLLAVVAMARESDWELTFRPGGNNDHDDIDRTVGSLLMLRVLHGDAIAVMELGADLARRIGYAGVPSLLVAPLISQNSPRGALVLMTDRPQTVIAAQALRSLGVNVSLAMEAAALTESLHQRRSEQRFRLLVENSPDIILVIGRGGITSFASPSAERLLGAENCNLDGLLAMLHPDDRPALSGLTLRAEEGHRTDIVEFRLDTVDGPRWFEATASNMLDDEIVGGIVLNARDITERKALEHDLRHKVLHDDLTGIANRVLFRDRLDHALHAARGGVPEVAVLFIDIDDFKTVNDGLGHDAGDELLKVIALRLEGCVRPNDTASRVGGDEFTVLLEGLSSPEDVMLIASRILETIVQPLQFGGREMVVSASIGVAMAERSATSEVLLRNADVAMYHAKRAGKNRVKLFDQAMYVSAFERLELKVELAHALERGELSLHYQPLVELQTRELFGFEALMRWTHPTLGPVPPGSFISLVEESGAIVEMGAWVLTEACRQLAEWRKTFEVDICMSVNISPRQLEEDRIVDDVRSAIEISRIDPSWLTLELTESAGLEDPASQLRLVKLRDLGCHVAADDFGAGFATYAALQQLPFTDVKIDRSLIAGLSTGDERAKVQVKSIIEMGHALGFRITAEGIEDSRQVDALVAMHADRGQGYLVGRPAPAGEASEHIRALITRR